MGAETFFKDVNGGGARTFLNTRIGGPILFMEKNGGAKTFLDRKIKVFPGGVPVNFGHSLTIIV